MRLNIENASPYKTYKFIGIIFIIIYLFITLILGAFIVGIKNDVKNSVQCDAIALIDYTDEITAKFSVDGIEYLVPLNMKNSSIHDGDVIKIYYDEDDPSKAFYDNSSMLIVLAISFSIFLIIGILFVAAYNRAKNSVRLIDEGIRLDALITHNGLSGVKINNANTYFIKCKYTDDMGKVHFFKSLLKFKPIQVDGDYVCVYIKDNNYRRYYVDV